VQPVARTSHRRRSGGGCTEKAKAAKLRKLDEQIEASTAELREAAKRVAIAAVEAQFAA
jgi:hypothetical protein